MAMSCPACGFQAPDDAGRCPECGANLDVEPAEEWLTAFVGSMSAVFAVQASLEDAEVPTFVPDAMTKTIDPFITGGNVFEVRLQVPAREHRRALEVLEELRRQAAATRSDESEDDEPPEGDPSFSDDELAILARRVRWSAITFFTAPFGLLWGLRYAKLARVRDPRPAGHGLTIAAVGLCLADVLAIAYFAGTGFSCVLRGS